ncbi:hypothetical protein PN498_05185 [Oscillatoria sp. CS-180]|uniref:hypothetical protein n=1 Tax=Oscillatoria sp. CS-180 TaxID=3021720 RepID=UPI00232AC249|nr:hypothetical protein [Oscillatoria sp. CS-180]MDB9525372.1 hypothetical protein [Oscillatoria sp. CS-180]
MAKMIFTMAYTTRICTTASALSTSRQRQKQSSSRSAFGSRLKAALEHASRLTEMHGTNNIDTIIAWEAVKELLKSHPYFSTLTVPNWSSDSVTATKCHTVRGKA